MQQYGNLLGFGSGERAMDAFVSNFIITAALLFIIVFSDRWTREAALGLIVFFAFIDLLSFFFYRMRARTKILVCEQGIMGRALTGFLSSADFSIPYAQIGNVEATKKSVTIYSQTGKFAITVANGLELQYIIRERLQTAASMAQGHPAQYHQ